MNQFWDIMFYESILALSGIRHYEEKYDDFIIHPGPITL